MVTDLSGSAARSLRSSVQRTVTVTVSIASGLSGSGRSNAVLVSTGGSATAESRHDAGASDIASAMTSLTVLGTAVLTFWAVAARAPSRAAWSTRFSVCA